MPRPIAAACTLAFTALFAVASAHAAPVAFTCSGAKVDAARKVAKANDLKLGLDPAACFGELQLTESPRKQIVVAAPGAGCNAKLLNVYDKSRSGTWYALFKKPVCGTSIAVGPKSPYGDNMITIDGTSYLEKGDDWVPFKR